MGDSAGVSFNGVHPVPDGLSNTAHIQSMEQYEAMYKRSLDDPEGFWGELGRKNLDWFREFDQAVVGTVNKGDAAWFLNGETNVSVNCIDRHVTKHPNKTAIIWEADEIGEGRNISYTELLEETCRIANAMKHAGVRRGDTVAIYMPMIPEVTFVMLACTRIGAVHSVVFAGFSSDALRDRVVDAQSQWVFTADEGKRGGRTLPLKQIVDHAVDGLDFVRKVFVFKRTHNPDVKMNPKIDVDMDQELLRHRPYCPAEFMNSEDLMFILYTSGSTAKYTFDLHKDDIFACVADAGWITGHSYIIYGPLANGVTTVMFESTPMYPHHGRYWDLVQRHKVTKFYTAPTAIRALMARGNDKIREYDLSSLKVLGSVGEPINPEAWKWYYEVVGNRQCYIADTYWQTETGGHIGVGLPGATPMKPGSCSKPFFGIDFVVTDEHGNEIKGNDVEGQLCIRKPWPGMARTVYGDHNRYLQVYMSTHKGLYFTGDGCRRDKDGYYFITGRIDDVLCTSGHRIGTAEIESALVAHNVVAEAAVIGIPHRIKGEGICCFVMLVDGVNGSKDVEKELVQQVRAQIGAFATPDLIVLVPGLPKTRSGKIMRRVLRKISHGEEDSLGDVSTLADPSVVPTLITNTKAALVGKTF
ncbi:acetyl-coenzyme A synthetase [Phytophthora infestans T30-4]|uniref:Acetyl-coenzyme A synthetase n=1 Tax=Phytophthora infestans (strain T30-4) TaxID=403677 RepID=D0MRI8_PHYIT|nr:acetyl-coenzyme A synthetase [Phytophthora infestans T30-4]EEY58107.1 acetyl-coenzyme A synthetase [Phytophthora infestans T30-4]|eukprot:XP_002909293.1 acetyl-coenzyme A synthetase [Phytophthora infestans T30-4]